MSEIPNEKQAEKHTDPDEDDGDKIARKQVRKYIGHPPKRGHAPEGWHPPRYPHPIYPRIARGLICQGRRPDRRDPPARRGTNPHLSGPGEQTHSRPQLTMVLVVGPGVGVQ